MAVESKGIGHQCLWFSCLLSRVANVPRATAAVKRVGAVAVEAVPMGQGQKASSVLFWTFQPTGKAQRAWALRRGWAVPEK